MPCDAPASRRAPGPVRAQLPPRVRRVQARLREGGRGRLRPLVGRHETRLVASESFVFVSSSLAFVRFAVRFAAYARRFAARPLRERQTRSRLTRVSRLTSHVSLGLERQLRGPELCDLRSSVPRDRTFGFAFRLERRRRRRRRARSAAEVLHERAIAGFLVLLRALGGFRDAPRSLRARLRHRARLRARLGLGGDRGDESTRYRDRGLASLASLARPPLVGRFRRRRASTATRVVTRRTGLERVLVRVAGVGAEVPEELGRGRGKRCARRETVDQLGFRRRVVVVARHRSARRRWPSVRLGRRERRARRGGRVA